jgi:FeS assembly SUF system protein
MPRSKASAKASRPNKEDATMETDAPPVALQPPKPAGESSSLPASTTSPALDIQETERQIIAALRTCYDPEIPVNIYEMGLIYGIQIEANGAVSIRMTLTSPMCPAAGSLPGDVQRKAENVAGVTAVKVDVVWDPIWNPEMMSEAARLQLGMF